MFPLLWPTNRLEPPLGQPVLLEGLKSSTVSESRRISPVIAMYSQVSVVSMLRSFTEPPLQVEPTEGPFHDPHSICSGAHQFGPLHQLAPSAQITCNRSAF